MTNPREHELLPWFVNGTLPPDEHAAFEKHLAECAACRQEQALLEALRIGVEQHGSGFLADHPSAERLVALLVPGSADDDPDEAEAVSLRRHVALCATCAEEARWLRGEAVASAPAEDARPKQRTHRWYWGVAAALLVALVALPLWLRRSAPHPDAEVARMILVPPTRRGMPERADVRFRRGAQPLILLFPVDLSEADFPATLVVTAADGRTVYRKEGIVFEDLYQGSYLVLRTGDAVFPDGSYLAQLKAARTDSASPTEYPFRVARERGDPAR